MLSSLRVETHVLQVLQKMLSFLKKSPFCDCHLDKALPESLLALIITLF